MSKRIKITIVVVLASLIVTLSSVVLYAAIKLVRVVSEASGGTVAVMPIKPIQLKTLAIEALVNVERANLGLPALAHSDQLTASACAKLDDMVAKDYWAHDAPDGTEPWTFIDAAGYRYTKSGENLAYGVPSDAMAVKGWMNSPGHRANLLGQFADQGICTKTAKYQGALNTIVVQHLGTR